jgi:hypothetical protein
MYFIGLDVHKKTISYCVKDAAGRVYQEGKIGSTRRELDGWIRIMPQPRTIAMEATIFTGWICDHLLPHAERVKVAHPLMLRAIAQSKKKARSPTVCGVISCQNATWPRRSRDQRRTLRYRNLVIKQMVHTKNHVSGLLSIQREGRAGVSELLRDNFRRHTGCKRDCGRRVAQIAESLIRGNPVKSSIDLKCFAR